MSEMALSASLQALEQVCLEDGYRFRIIDPYSRQLARVEKGTNYFYAGIGRVHNFPLNNAGAASIAKDKAFTYLAVAAAGLPVPDYGYFFLNPAQVGLRGTGREREDAFAYAAARGYPVFVKPLDGSRGALADIAYSAKDLAGLLDAIAAVHHGALIQDVLVGADRRLFLIDGEVMFAYRRTTPVLMGNGKQSVGALLAAYNHLALAAGITPVPESSPFLREALRRRDMTLQTILDEGTPLPFTARANVSAGGTIADYSEDAPANEVAWARQIMAAVGLRVAGIDYFVATDQDGKPRFDLIEVNSNPNLAGAIGRGRVARVREIWRRIAGTYFSELEARLL